MASLRKRGKMYYASYYVAGRERRRSLETTSYQLAKERLRNLEHVLGTEDPDSLCPTKTPVARIVGEYVGHIRTIKTKTSFKTDRWLCLAFNRTRCYHCTYTICRVGCSDD
jgi:hypothetical protein